MWEDAEVSFTVGSADDLWVDINNKTVISMPGIKDFEPETFTVELSSGQYPLAVRFAHRSGESGMRFRPLSVDAVTICYPDFDDDTG